MLDRERRIKEALYRFAVGPSETGLWRCDGMASFGGHSTPGLQYSRDDSEGVNIRIVAIRSLFGLVDPDAWATGP